MSIIIWYDCPSCGKPKSSDGEHFCGECEDTYQREMFEEKEREIAELRRLDFQCPCADGDCPECCSRHARILELNGDPRAAQYLNM